MVNQEQIQTRYLSIVETTQDMVKQADNGTLIADVSLNGNVFSFTYGYRIALINGKRMIVKYLKSLIPLDKEIRAAVRSMLERFE